MGTILWRPLLALSLWIALSPLFSCEGGGKNGYLEQKAQRMAEQEASRNEKLGRADSLSPSDSKPSNGYLEAKLRRKAQQDSSFAAREKDAFEKRHEVVGDSVVRKLSPYEEAKLRRIKEQQESKKELTW